MTTIYYSPGHYGLETVGILDEADLDYQFHILAIWKDASGKIYWDEDSGCSCPAPFEDSRFNGPDDHNLETDVALLFTAIDDFPADERDKNAVRGYLALEGLAAI